MKLHNVNEFLVPDICHCVSSSNLILKTGFTTINTVYVQMMRQYTLRIIYCDYIATKILTKKKENQKLSLFIVQIYQGHINSSSNAQNTEISINICFQYCYFVFLKQFFTSDIDLTLSKWNPKLILINLILIILI